MTPSMMIARKEAGELLLSIRGLAWLTTAALALSAFGLLLIGSAELSLLDNAQVVYDMAAIGAALGALLALVVGIDTVAGERERGSLTPLILTPVSRGAILAGKLGGVAIAWAAVYALTLPYLWAVGATGPNMGAAIAVSALFGTPVVLGFGMFGMGLGAAAGSARSALMIGLAALVVSASPLLLGPSLRQSAIGRMFDAVNPFSAAVNAYDAVIIDSQPIAAHGWQLAVAIVWLIAAAVFARSGARNFYR